MCGTPSPVIRRPCRTGDDHAVVIGHAHPGLVAVYGGVADSEGRREFSSGLLIGPRLVLTSRHGVASGDGGPMAGVEVRFVAGPRGAVRVGEPVPGVVRWAGAGDLDAALVELPEGTGVPVGFAASGLLWG